MYKTIKNIAFLIAIAFTFSLTSCIDDPEVPAVRTLAMEQAELQQIFDNIEESELTIETTELGIYYLVDTMGTGPLVQAGDTCFIRYTGQFLDGTVFDASHFHQENPDGVWELIFQEIPLIPGFDDGIALMNKGAKLDLIIPSEFAYGLGTTSIPAYTPLIFSVEMVDLKPFIEVTE
jgi:FKBP-type peptidyl-prolyl cis-trans isomerase FkpA